MLEIARHPKYSHFIIQRVGQGTIPEILSGLFTDMRYAQEALDAYTLKCEEEEAKKLAAEKKHQEALDKPLGHTQRKKSNAKKSSSSGK